MRVIGRREYVSFPLLGIYQLEAKIDTGAYNSSIHCEDIILRNIDNEPVLFVVTKFGDEEPREFSFREFTTKKIRNSFGELEERFIIRTVIAIGHKRIRAGISLTKRDKMRYPVLIGRKPLKGKFLIDVKEVHLGGMKLSRAFKNKIIK